MAMSVGGQHRLDQVNRQDGGGIKCRRPRKEETTRNNRVKNNMNSMTLKTALSTALSTKRGGP